MHVPSPEQYTAVIRQASEDDLAKMARLGRHFHTEAGLDDVAEYSEADTEQTLRTLLANPDGILLVAEVGGEIAGFAGGMGHPIYFNHGHKTGQELFWWVRPENRGGIGRILFDALEGAAREIGCVSWGMIALDKVQPEAVGALYRRRGYRPSEHTWIKRL